jgi:chromate reductase
MEGTFRILGFAGSLRKGSYNRALLRTAATVLPDRAQLDIFELDDIPGFSEDIERDPPPKIIDFKQCIRGADGLLIATPEYNYSVPGVLKNAIDWASRPYGDNAFDGKPVAIMGASIGMLGTARAQYHLRQTCVFLNMYPLNRPEVMVPFAQDKTGRDGSIADPKAKDLVRDLLVELVRWGRRLSSDG